MLGLLLSILSGGIYSLFFIKLPHESHYKIGNLTQLSKGKPSKHNSFHSFFSLGASILWILINWSGALLSEILLLVAGFGPFLANIDISRWIKKRRGLRQGLNKDLLQLQDYCSYLFHCMPSLLSTVDCAGIFFTETLLRPSLRCCPTEPFFLC